MSPRTPRPYRPLVEPLDKRDVPSALGHASPVVSAQVIAAGASSPAFPPGLYMSTAGEFTSLLHPGRPVNTTPSLTLAVDGNARISGKLSFTTTSTRHGAPVPLDFQSTSLAGRAGPTGLFTVFGSGPLANGGRAYFVLSGSLAASTLTGRYVIVGGPALDVGTFTFTLSGGISGAHVGWT